MNDENYGQHVSGVIRVTNFVLSVLKGRLCRLEDRDQDCIDYDLDYSLSVDTDLKLLVKEFGYRSWIEQMESAFAWKIIRDRQSYYYVTIEDLGRSIECIELWLNQYEASHRSRKSPTPQKCPSPRRSKRTKKTTIILRSQYETEQSRKSSKIRSGLDCQKFQSCGRLRYASYP